MLKRSAGKAVMLLLAGGVVAGCSETGFQDLFGAGKYSPDETQVAAQQPLSVPPDLQLRPPSDAPPPQPQTVTSQPATAEPPSQGGLQQPQDMAAEPETEEAPQQPDAPAEQVAASQPQDVYARWGVSRRHPDGREKTQGELNEEMRQKKIEMERQKNPNYGTIWNLGSIWSDD